MTAAVFRDREPEALRVDRLPYDLKKLRRYFERLQADGEARACYEASGAGYVLSSDTQIYAVGGHPDLRTPPSGGVRVAPLGLG
ncbi:MAG: hypothetical protein ACF8NJ_08665 [Phycisphaerales bacterium JB038]